MELNIKYIIFVASILVLLLILFISYKIGYKAGIKKSLYRITYISISVLLAFIISPYLTEYVLNYNLYPSGKAIMYNELHFYRIIDFIEEVIVHNEILNDIYNLFPSLKKLLIDFPQVLFIPFAYVITFVLNLLFLLPLYLFFSYKRPKRVLYETTVKNCDRVWAGILTIVQSIFLISIIFTPINGLTRVYNESKQGLIEENDNICRQNEYLKKYEIGCKVIEGYNSSIFSLIGRNPVNAYIYDSLTRISYSDSETSLNLELVSIARAGVILNKTGLLEAVNVEDFEDVSKLDFTSLTEEDIDIVVEAFNQSLYTKDIVYEVYEWSKDYLDWLMQDLIDKKQNLLYTYDDIVRELKIVLKAINFLMDNPSYLENITNIYRLIKDFAEASLHLTPGSPGLRLFFDILQTLDIDSTIRFYEILKHSSIYNDIIPKIFVNFLNKHDINVSFDKNTQEMNIAMVYVLNIANMIKKYSYNRDILQILNDLKKDELFYFASFVEFLSTSKTMNTMAYDLIKFGVDYAQIKLDLPIEVVYKIKDWYRELELVQMVIQIVYTNKTTGVIDYDKAIYALKNYDDTILFKTAFKYAINKLPDIFISWLAGKDYKYLVGEYV